MITRDTANVGSLLERILLSLALVLRIIPSVCMNPISVEPAWSYVKDCLDTGWVSTAGNWVSRFERELCVVTGAQNAVVVSNGTVALRLALHLVVFVPEMRSFYLPLVLLRRPILSPILVLFLTLLTLSRTL